MSRILLVDDDEDSLQLYRGMLADHGHEVAIAKDGVHALAALDRSTFDVMITDLVMPYIDGERLARLARHRFPNEPLLIVMFSAAATEHGAYTNPYVDAYVAKGKPEATTLLLQDVIRRPEVGERLRVPPDVKPRRITRELLQTEEDFALVLEQMSQGVVRLDRNETVVSANRAALEYLSHKEEDFLGRSFWELLEERTKEQFSPLFGPRPIDGERRRSTIVLDKGTTVLRAELIAPKGSASNMLTLFLTDVTAEHTVSENLRRSERNYRSIVESTTDLLWTIDRQNNLKYISPGTLRFTGYSAAEYESAGVRLLLGAASEEELQSILSEAQARAYRGESYQFEKELPIKGDGHFWSLIKVSPLVDENGDCQGVEFLATNIDRSKKAEDKLRRAVVERETLIREIHHRVKNSVQVIVSMIRLRLGTHPDAEVQAIAEGLENRIRIIAEVYAQLYEHNSLDRLDGSALIDQSVALALDQMPRFAVEYQKEPFILSLDLAIPLALLVRELVRNVAYHVYPFVQSAHLRICSEVHDSELELRFTDNGPGMSAEQLENPYSLGFLIAQSSAAQLKGKLYCETPEEGGTTILLRCPYEAPPLLEEAGTF